MEERCIIKENWHLTPQYIREGKWFAPDTPTRHRRLGIDLEPLPIDERAAYVAYTCELLVKSRFDRFYNDFLVNQLTYRVNPDHHVFVEWQDDGEIVPSYRIANEVSCLDEMSIKLGICHATRRIAERYLNHLTCPHNPRNWPRGPTEIEKRPRKTNDTK